jgi:2-polyprenyl-6-methoxyphenol hydroxylase-like FAD-dependent oxidoreductase
MAWNRKSGEGWVSRATDVFIVGGGPFAKADAELRKRGFSVIVADGAKPPIDKACGEGLLPEAIDALRNVGVEFEPHDGHVLSGIRFLDRGTTVQASFPKGIGLGMRRLVLHERMFERAQECGVSFLWNVPVTGVLEGGVIAGGEQIKARWIIGADGIRSRVRRWAGLDAHTRFCPRFAFRQHYRIEPWSEHAEIHWGETGQAYVTPVGKREVCVVFVCRKPGVSIETTVGEFPELSKSLGKASPSSVARGALTAMHRLRRVYRGNTALIGDASGGVDAITGQGLCLSFLQASALADALAANDLGSYQKQHRRLAWRPTMMGHLMLLLDGRAALRQRAMRAWSAKPGLFSRFLALHAGEISTVNFATAATSFGWQFMTA